MISKLENKRYNKGNSSYYHRKKINYIKISNLISFVLNCKVILDMQNKSITKNLVTNTNQKLINNIRPTKVSISTRV